MYTRFLIIKGIFWEVLSSTLYMFDLFIYYCTQNTYLLIVIRIIFSFLKPKNVKISSVMYNCFYLID